MNATSPLMAGTGQPESIDDARLSRLLACDVDPGWIDVNGHVSDRHYGTVFSRAEVAFLHIVGVDEDYRAETGGGVYTCEAHVSYHKELREGDHFSVSARIVDLTNKAVHLVFELQNRRGDLCATHESLLLHVRKNEAGDQRVSPFGRYVLANLVHIHMRHRELAPHPAVGRSIGIRRKGEG